MAKRKRRRAAIPRTGGATFLCECGAITRVIETRRPPDCRYVLRARRCVRCRMLIHTQERRA